MDKQIKKKLEKLENFLKITKNKKKLIYNFNKLTIENGFELDYFVQKKKSN